MTNNDAGFSFMSHPGNQLAKTYLKLCYRASKVYRNRLWDSDWDQSGIFQYSRKEEALRASILGGMLCTGGQLPRCTEILSLYCVFGKLHPRGVFKYDRSMIYITRHHKTKRSTNGEFVVACFLLAQLRYKLYKYLVYIWPFIDMLYWERELLTKAPDSPFLLRHKGEATIKP
ncbi:hypothetical protein EDB80DRAFT_576884 [Ilyonectria destructans]|nr:hypothetical protein EDB80DRAFT_576884 [Ilyonectria destructans]